MKFNVSVIIPVFNAEDYVALAINSALEQKEVEEVIVVNDGSTDNTQNILEEFLKLDSRVIIYYHLNKKNLGRSASRNLGIKNASCNFIAFLDADDYYLPNRFLTDKKVFNDHPDADGVYNAIGAKFYKDANLEEKDRLKLTTLSKSVLPKNLFFEMWPKGYSGSFSGDGLTVKKEIFKKVGFFNQTLEVAEDTDLFIKMALTTKLYPGELREPVCIRGIHGNNAIHELGGRLYIGNYFKMYKGLLIWGYKKNVPSLALDYFWERLYQHFKLLHKNDSFLNLKELIFWLKMGINVPILFKYKRFWKNSLFYQLKSGL